MISKEIFQKSLEFGQTAVNALKKSVSPYNFVEHAKKELKSAGFLQIYESDPWNLEPGKKYFYTRNNSCIIAFNVGKKFNPEESCFKIIGAHTDSPSLRIAPNSYNPSGEIERYNVQYYGGGLWFTWLDRDLSLAGKVIFKDNEGKLTSKIIQVEEPIFFIPNCPPHLKSGSERESLTINKESHLKPLIATLKVNNILDEEENEKEKKECKDKKLGKTLRKIILKELNKGLEKNVIDSGDQIVDYDLALYDTQSPSLIGLNKEFLASGRLDNLGSSIPALYSMINASKEELLAEQTSINIIALFDNEEIGSMTYQGADSNFFLMHLKRIFSQSLNITKTPFSEDLYLRFMAKSYVISADLAHAYNPNYSEKFQSQHQNKVQQGVVLKINCNGRYSTESENAAVFKELGKLCNVPIQEFIVRQDSPCGTTIGPITSAKIGIKSVDVGIAQFAMHSIREQLGIVDLYYYKTIFEEFFKSYEKVKGNILRE
jgi:aspartyl aminopeptidase